MNPHRGEVALSTGSAEYKLRFSTNALVELEEETGLGINTIAAQISSPDGVRLKMLRALLWAGLRDNHSDITQAQAGEIMDDVGKTEVFAKLGDAFTLAFPSDESNQEKGTNGARPPKAGGSGLSSSPALQKPD